VWISSVAADASPPVSLRHVTGSSRSCAAVSRTPDALAEKRAVAELGERGGGRLGDGRDDLEAHVRAVAGELDRSR